MSDVLQRFREKYPAYDDVSDEELTLRIGTKYPVYLDRDPQFKQDFQTQVGTLGLKAAISGQGALLNTLTSPAAGEASEMGRQESARDKLAFESRMALPASPKLAGARGMDVSTTSLGRGPLSLIPPEEAPEGWTPPPGPGGPIQVPGAPFEGTIQTDLALSKPPGTAEKIGRGVGESLLGLGDFMLSPLGIATLGIGGLPAAVQRTVALGFATQMASQTPEIARELGTEFGKPAGERDTTKIAKLITDAATTTGFTVGAGFKGLAPTRIPTAQITETAKVAPLTAQVLQQQITGEALKVPRGAERPLSPEEIKAAEALGMKWTTEVEDLQKQKAQTKPVERTPDASSISKTTEVYGDVQPREEPTGGVPVTESGAGVQPQAEGRLPTEAQEPQAPPQQDVASANRPAVKLMPQESGQQELVKAERKPDGKWETHDDIIERAKLSTEDIDRRIFVDEQGNEKSREQTAQDLAQQGVPTEIPGQAHSTDVNAAIEAKQEVAPATPEPTVEAKGGGTFESWFQKAQEKFPSAGVADWKADWLKENRMARWTYKKNPEAVRKIKGLPASYEYTGEVQFAGERIPFNFFSDVRGVKKSSAQAAWHAIERRYYERTKGVTEGLRERVGEQPTEPVPSAATGSVGVGEREPARVEPQPVEPPPPAPVSGAGTPSGESIPPRVLPGAGINSKDVARQYGMPEDFYGTGDEQGMVSSKYRSKEYDDAVAAEKRVANLQGINATTIRRQARQRTEAAFKDIVAKARGTASAAELGRVSAPPTQGLTTERQAEAGRPPTEAPSQLPSVTHRELGGLTQVWVKLEGKPEVNVGSVEKYPNLATKEGAIDAAQRKWRFEELQRTHGIKKAQEIINQEAQAGAGTPEPAVAAQKVGGGTAKPRFTMTFEQFLKAPREGELLESLRTLPKRQKSPEETTAQQLTDSAYAALEKAKLTWMIDHPEQGVNLSKAKRRIWDNYNKAWQERGRIEKAHQEEAQRHLYDEAVKAGIIEPPPAPPEKGAPEVAQPLPESRKPAQILGESARVKVTVPEGATMLRVTDTKGRTSTLSLSEVNKGDNPFHGVEVRKLEAGSIGKDKRFNVVKGDVAVEDLTPKLPPGPGAKTVGEPEYSAIQQLTDQLKAEQAVGPREKLVAGEKIADAWAEGKTLVDKAIGKMLAIRQSLKDTARGVREVTDLDRLFGAFDWVLQKSAAQSVRGGEVIRKQTRNPAWRDAAAIWNDTPGTPAEKRAAIQNALDNLPAKTHPRVKRALQTALNMPPEAIPLSESLKQYFGIRSQDAIEHEIFEQGLADYYTHVWRKEENMPNELRAAINNGRLSEYFQFARQRQIPTLIEGILQGKTPVLDPADVVPYYNYALDRAIASREFIRAGSELMEADGRPTFAPSGVRNIITEDTSGVNTGGTFIRPRAKGRLKVGNELPAEEVERLSQMKDYRAIDHPAMRKWKWAGIDENGNPILYQGDLLVHPDAYERIARQLDRGRLTPTRIGRIALRASTEVKGFKLGLLSAFHAVHVSSHAAFHWTNPFKAAAREIDWELPSTRFAVEKGHIKIGPDPSEINIAAEGIASGGLVHKVPFIGPWSRAWSEWQFGKLIPRLKLETFNNAYSRAKWMQEHLGFFKGLTDEQIAARIGDSINNAFGELNYMFKGKYGRDPRLQRLLRGIFLAPDFGEARLGFAGKALTKYGHEERLALATMFLTLYGTARIANWLSHGDPEWDWRNAFAVKSGKHWWSMRSVVGDLDHAFADFGRFMYVRLNPLYSRTTADILFGRDISGRKLTATQKYVTRPLQQLVPIQFGGLTRDDQKLWESFVTAMGVSTRRDTPTMDVHRLVSKWKEKSTDPKIHEAWQRAEQTTFAPSPYEPMRNALRQDNPKRAREEYNKLITQGRQPSVIRDAMGRDRPFTGSWANERKFKGSLSPIELKLYQQAVEEHRQLNTKFRAMLAEPSQ